LATWVTYQPSAKKRGAICVSTNVLSTNRLTATNTSQFG